MVDAILPPMDELDKQISQETLKAVAQYVQMKEQQKQQAQITGQQVPPFNAQELMPIVAQLQKQIATPTEKIIKKTPQVRFERTEEASKAGGEMKLYEEGIWALYLDCEFLFCEMDGVRFHYN